MRWEEDRAGQGIGSSGGCEHRIGNERGEEDWGGEERAERSGRDARDNVR